MTIKQRPIIAITMGDAAGIGPEIIVKALLSEQIYSICRPLLVGEGTTMSAMMGLLDSPLKLKGNPALLTSLTCIISTRKKLSWVRYAAPVAKRLWNTSPELPN
jgi:4-hydroxy-L-threonine phosphate dehydrogenase PdxA